MSQFLTNIMEIIVLHHQSLLDLAIQHTGVVENAFDLALANNRSLTDELAAGDWLIANSQELKTNKDILSYYQAKKLQPATGVSHTGNQINQPQGIDYWAISYGFIVS